jgi:uncharacterized membrane protein
MTKKRNEQTPDRLGSKWFHALMEHLKPSNITKAQKANVVLDAIGGVCFIALVFSDTHDAWKVLSFLGVIGFAIWCHAYSTPRKRRT